MFKNNPPMTSPPSSQIPLSHIELFLDYDPVRSDWPDDTPAPILHPPLLQTQESPTREHPISH